MAQKRSVNLDRPDKPNPSFPLSPGANGHWWKEIKGKRYYFGRWENDRDGSRALADYEARLPFIREGTDHLRQEVPLREVRTVGGVVRAYLETAKRRVETKEMSFAWYGDLLKELPLMVEYFGVGTKVSALRPHMFASFVDEVMVKERNLGPYARARAISIIRTAFNWAADNDVCDKPKFGTGFRKPAIDPASVRQHRRRSGVRDYSQRILTGEEVDTLMSWFDCPQVKAATMLGVNCGLTPADITGLRYHQVNLSTGELDLPRDKTGVERRSYMWKRTRRHMARVMELDISKKAFEKDGEDALVFVSKEGGPLASTKVRVEGGAEVGVSRYNLISGRFAQQKKRLEGAGGIKPGVTFYRLRHTFKTLGKAAKDPDALDLAMGHKGLDIRKTYDHEIIPMPRLKRIAKAVYRGLWPEGRKRKVTPLAAPSEPTQDVVAA
jgi:integrase